MRRDKYPFYNNRFVLNKNTGEIHDLDNEQPDCEIDKIKPEHIYSSSTYINAKIAGVIFCKDKTVNGCFYCLKEKNNG